MAIDREAIYVALFQRLQTIPGFVTMSRRWRHMDDVLQVEQPALFLLQGNETPQEVRGMPPQWRLEPTIVIYARHDSDPNIVPGTALNGLIQSVEAALEKQFSDGPYGGPNEWSTTLGGLCSYVKIAGQIVTDEGILGEQAFCLIPLEILARS